ncbi:hypothetical protein AVEN_22509-1, partial [Araneus ventricosus]
YGRQQETYDEKEENVILIEESEDEDFGFFKTRNGVCVDRGSNLYGIIQNEFSSSMFCLDRERWRCQNEGTLAERLRDSRSG